MSSRKKTKGKPIAVNVWEFKDWFMMIGYDNTHKAIPDVIIEIDGVPEVLDSIKIEGEQLSYRDTSILF